MSSFSNSPQDPSNSLIPPEVQRNDAPNWSSSAFYDPEFIEKLNQAGTSWRKETEGSLLGHVALTLAWGFGFYLISILLGIGLFALPFLIKLHYIPAILYYVALGAALHFAIVPRIDRIVGTGPELFEKDHPHLFHILHQVANQLGTAMPHHVYLLLDVNAFVTYRGGMLGLGSKKVMGLGLPLLQTLTIAELQAVIAHEFGHFIGGDVPLGSWIYKIRQCMINLIIELQGNTIQKLFIFSTWVLLKLSQSISRRQEYQADSVAAKLQGANVLITALGKLDSTALAFKIFMDQEYVPVLDAGLRPPLGDGFQTYYKSSLIQNKLQELLEEQDPQVIQGSFDSHPNKTKRYQAAMRFAPKSISSAQSALASSLINNSRDQEQKLFAGFLNKSYAKNPFASWQETGVQIYQPRFSEEVRADETLMGLQVSKLPLYLEDRALASAAYQNSEIPLDEHFWTELSKKLVSALGSVLTAKGWVLLYEPGYRYRMTRDGRTIILREILEQAASEPKGRADWQRLVEDEQLAGKTVAEFLEHLPLPKTTNPPLPSSDTDPKSMWHQVSLSNRYLTTFWCGTVGFIGALCTWFLVATESPQLAFMVGAVTAALIALPFILLKWPYSAKPGHLALTEQGFSLKMGQKESHIAYSEIKSLVLKKNKSYKDEQPLGEVFILEGTSSAGAFRMVHFDQSGNPFFGHLVNLLIERYAQSLSERINSGALIRTKKWMADSKHLYVAGKKYDWLNLVRPCVADGQLIFWKLDQAKPLLKLPIDQDHVQVLLGLAEKFIQATQVDDERGGLIARHGWKNDLLFTLVAMPLALLYLPMMLKEDPIVAVGLGLVVLGCVLHLTIHFGKGTVIYTRGVSQRKWYKERFLKDCDFASMKLKLILGKSMLKKRLFTYEFLLKDHDNQKLVLKGSVAEEEPSSYLILQEMVSHSIAEQMRAVISTEGSIQWVPGVYFHRDKLQVTQKKWLKEISFTAPYKSCQVHFEKAQLVLYPENQADKAIHISISEDNFYPGWEVFRSLIT